MSASAEKSGRLAWYAARLASMSAPEIGHRVIERAKQFQDARRRWSWDTFAGSDTLAPLRAFDPARASACLTPAVEAQARAVLSGEIALLSARWPKPDGRAWWRSEIWTLDPISGSHWPGRGGPASKSAYRHAHGFGDIKFVWELNRLQFLMPLAIAARRDNDASLAADIADTLQGWMEANPPYQGVNWTNGIEAASRLVVALVVNTLLADMRHDALRAPMRAFVAAHAFMLARYPSLFSSANNHRVAELSALYLAYRCAPWLKGAGAGRAHVRHALEQEVAKQFHGDGVGAEQSPTYAAYSLEWFAIAALCAEQSGEPFSNAYRARLALAAQHLRWMMDAAGRTPAIGDDDEGRVLALGPARDYPYPAAICATVSRWLCDGAAAPPRQPPTLLDALTPAPDVAPAPPAGRRTFAEGGYTVWRAPHPRGPLLLAFDHAPLGFLSIAAHGHADALSVWLHVGAEPLIVDAGTYLYHTESDARSRFRGTLAHNTLTLEGADQSRIAGPFNWSHHAKAELLDAGAVVRAQHDGYLASHGVRHLRSVHLDGARIEIVDALEGKLAAPAAWSVGLTFHPAVRIVAREDGLEAIMPSGARASVSVRFAHEGQIRIDDTEVSGGFGRSEMTKRLIASGRVEAGGPVAVTSIEIA